MKHDVLMLSPTRPDAQARLEQQFTLHRLDLADDRPAFLARHGAACRGMVAMGHTSVDAALLDQAGSWTVQGDPTEAAFLVAERKLGTTEQRMRRLRRRGEIQFSSERKLMSTLEEDAAHAGEVVVMTLGGNNTLITI